MGNNEKKDMMGKIQWFVVNRSPRIFQFPRRSVKFPVDVQKSSYGAQTMIKQSWFVDLLIKKL